MQRVTGKRTRKGNRKVQRGRRPAGQELVNRTLNFMPSRFRTHLTFNKLATLGLASSSQAVIIYFQPTFAYDVDPQVGSDAMAGFFELSKLYTKYRVNGYSIMVDFCNNEQFGVECSITPQNFAPGSGLTPKDLLANPRTKRALVGTYAQYPKRLRDRVSVADFGGSANTKIVDTYTALTAGPTAPVNNLFHVIAIFTDVGVFGQGVTIDAKITVDIEFLEMASPLL